MAMNCLAGPSCATEYIDAGSFNTQSMQRLFGDASLLAPYVRVRVSGPAGEITVGNQSSPNVSNHAVIKNFQYGRGNNGVGVNITIVDEDGGTFTNFIQKIVNKFDTANEKYELDCEWGWIKKGCDNNEFPLFKTQNLHRCVLLTVDIQMGSVITFELEGNDLMEVAFEGKINSTYGTDDTPMRLKDAIVKIFQEGKPPIKNVQFLRKLCGGGTEVWEFLNDPKGVWQAENDDALSAVMRWIRPFVTDKKKGIIPGWRDDLNEPCIVFFEDYSPSCNTEENCDPIASFIVNGGNCSNVLSFKTNIHWTFAALANTGGASSLNTAENVLQDEADVNSDCPTLDEQDAGTRTSNVTGENAERNYGRDALKEVTKADKAHDRATRKNSGFEPIEGELTLIGNPNLDSFLFIGSMIGILYINPIHLESVTSGCATWIATSNCNPVLSNKEWLITGLSHEISESGTYTTTLRLYLASPGVDIGQQESLGGNTSGYFIGSSP